MKLHDAARFGTLPKATALLKCRPDRWFAGDQASERRGAMRLGCCEIASGGRNIGINRLALPTLVSTRHSTGRAGDTSLS
jgi:hypothetical protein